MKDLLPTCRGTGFTLFLDGDNELLPSISLTGCQYLATVALFYTAFGAAHLPWDSPWTISVCLDVPHIVVYWKCYEVGS